MVHIGNVEIPIVSAVEKETEAEVDEIKPLHHLDSVTVKHEPSVESIIIVGYLNEELHSSGLTLDEQREEMKLLRGIEKLNNSFTYDDFKGYLLIENVDIPDTSDSKIVEEVQVEARYFPWPKYYPESEP